MSRFYGWALKDVREMDVEEFELADLAIKQLDAQERIIDVNVAIAPHMSQADAEKFQKGLHALAYQRDEVVQTISVAQLKELGLG